MAKARHEMPPEIATLSLEEPEAMGYADDEREAHLALLRFGGS